MTDDATPDRAAIRAWLEARHEAIQDAAIDEAQQTSPGVSEVTICDAVDTALSYVWKALDDA